MKKIISVALLFVVMATIFAGCSSKENAQESNTSVLRVGIDLKFYPFMYLDDAGNPAGLEVDIAHAFGEYIGKEVEIVNTDFSMLIPALETGDVDILISDMSASPDRELKADFTKPYRYAKTLALVNKDFATEHNITSDMEEIDFFGIEGMKFAGLAGTIAVTVPREFNVEVIEYTEISSALMEVTRGSADALVGANTIYGDHAANKEQTIVYDGITKVSASSFAVKKGDADLLQQANEFIDSMYGEDGFYEKAGTKYDEKIAAFMQNEDLGLDYIILSE